MKGKILWGVIGALVFCAPAAFAQTTWVVDQGGAGDFTAIQACIDGSASGDTCLVNPGTYVEHLSIAKSLTVISQDGPDVTIVDGATGVGYPVVVINSGVVVFEGFTLKNGVYVVGGGIAVFGSNVTIRDCVITDNYVGALHATPDTGGGGVYLQGAKATIENCLIQGNAAYGSDFIVYVPTYGGGICARSTDLTLTNSVISDNLVDYGYGGGLYLQDSSAEITNCTIADNQDDLGATGGIQIAGTTSSEIVNTILWNAGAEVTGSATVTYSDVEGGFSGTGNIDTDPLFVGSGDYHLAAGSPCIDVGNNLTPQIPSTDLDGNIRLRDGDCDGVFTVDLGPYERLTSCGWGVASTAIAGDRNVQSRMSSRAFNSVIVLLAPLSGLFLWTRLRRRS